MSISHGHYIWETLKQPIYHGNNTVKAVYWQDKKCYPEIVVEDEKLISFKILRMPNKKVFIDGVDFGFTYESEAKKFVPIDLTGLIIGCYYDNELTGKIEFTKKDFKIQDSNFVQRNVAYRHDVDAKYRRPNVMPYKYLDEDFQRITKCFCATAVLSKNTRIKTNTWYTDNNSRADKEYDYMSDEDDNLMRVLSWSTDSFDSKDSKCYLRLSSTDMKKYSKPNLKAYYIPFPIKIYGYSGNVINTKTGYDFKINFGDIFDPNSYIDSAYAEYYLANGKDSTLEKELEILRPLEISNYSPNSEIDYDKSLKTIREKLEEYSSGDHFAIGMDETTHIRQKNDYGYGSIHVSRGMHTFEKLTSVEPYDKSSLDGEYAYRLQYLLSNDSRNRFNSHCIYGIGENTWPTSQTIPIDSNVNTYKISTSPQGKSKIDSVIIFDANLSKYPSEEGGLWGRNGAYTFWGENEYTIPEFSTWNSVKKKDGTGTERVDLIHPNHLFSCLPRTKYIPCTDKIGGYILRIKPEHAADYDKYKYSFYRNLNNKAANIFPYQLGYDIYLEPRPFALDYAEPITTYYNEEYHNKYKDEFLLTGLLVVPPNESYVTEHYVTMGCHEAATVTMEKYDEDNFLQWEGRLYRHSGFEDVSTVNNEMYTSTRYMTISKAPMGYVGLIAGHKTVHSSFAGYSRNGKLDINASIYPFPVLYFYGMPDWRDYSKTESTRNFYDRTLDALSKINSQLHISMHIEFLNDDLDGAIATRENTAADIRVSQSTITKRGSTSAFYDRTYQTGHYMNEFAIFSLIPPHEISKEAPYKIYTLWSCPTPYWVDLLDVTYKKYISQDEEHAGNPVTSDSTGYY